MTTKCITTATIASSGEPLNDQETIQEDAPSNPQSESRYTRGPWRAWSTVVGAWTMQFCTVGVMSAFGVMQTFYVDSFLDNVSPSAISWIGSIQLFLDLVLAAPGGRLLDRGYFRHVVITGSIFFVICQFMLSLAEPQQYYQVLLTQGLGLGIGVGLVYLPTSVIASQHFNQNKGLAMGVVMSGGSLGSVVFSIALNYLLNGSYSFGWAMRIIGISCVGLLFIGNILIFDPRPSGHHSTSTLHQQHVEDAARPSIEKRASMDVKEDLVVPAEDITQTPITPFWDSKFVCVLGMGFLTGVGKWFPSYYVQLFAQQHGIGSQLAFYAVAIMNISNMFGRIVSNWLGDRYDPLRVYTIFLFCTGAIEFALLGCSTPYGLVIFTILYGFFLGTSVSLYLPVVDSIGSTVDTGTRLGISLLPVGIGSLIGTPISGAILGDQYHWLQGVAFAAATMLAGALLLSSITIPRLGLWGTGRLPLRSPELSGGCQGSEKGH